MHCAPSNTPKNVDVEALREKYAEERDKRVRKEGSKQYVHVTGELADFWEVDPYSPVAERDPVVGECDVVIVGGGFGGLLAGAQLKRAGISDVRMIDMAGDFGGVWYWNRYPGIQCDNESYTYMPLLEELGYMPSKRFADGGDIYEHCQNIGRHFGLYDGALFGTMIRSIQWIEGLQRWKIRTNRGDEISARFVIMATGPWNKPKLPGIPGITDFSGHSFHSARWDYDYTGGSPDDPVLDKLSGKRVALIGTGATAIQVVPYLGRYAEHLFVFQRTPSAVDERRNDPTDPEWAARLAPGWQRDRQANFHAFSWEPFPPADGTEDYTCDFFTEVNRNMASRIAATGRTDQSVEELIAIREQEDYAVMERIRQLAGSIVQDKDAAEALKPYYRYLCKRPCSSSDYLQSFNRPNVTLVDVSSSKGVERITETELIANGQQYEVDCIIFASGFEISAQDQAAAYGIETIEGRNGLSLYDYWKNGFKTLHGMTSHGFPGMFFTGFTQAGVSASVTAMYEQQGEHIAYIIGETMARGAPTVEPTQQAQDQWVQTIRDNAPPKTFLAECTPGYYNNEGGGNGGIRAAVGDPYGPGFFAFDRLIREWRGAGDLSGLVLEKTI